MKLNRKTMAAAAVLTSIAIGTPLAFADGPLSAAETQRTAPAATADLAAYYAAIGAGVAPNPGGPQQGASNVEDGLAAFYASVGAQVTQAPVITKTPQTTEPPVPETPTPTPAEVDPNKGDKGGDKGNGGKGNGGKGNGGKGNGGNGGSGNGGKGGSTEAPSTSVKSTEDVNLRVAVYNIKSAKLSDGLDNLAGVMSNWNADVLLLQEVDKGRYYNGGVDQAQVLANKLGGYQAVFGANVSYGGSALYGTAIVSRYPIVSMSNTPLPNGPGGEPRGLLHAIVKVNGQEVSFYSTHLQHMESYYSLRVTQAQRLVDILAKDPRPKVIGGDFNTAPNGQPISIMRSLLTDVWNVAGDGSEGDTVPTVNPRNRIDYQFFSGLKPVDARVPAVFTSDHRPILANYILKGS